MRRKYEAELGDGRRPRAKNRVPRPDTKYTYDISRNLNQQIGEGIPMSAMNDVSTNNEGWEL